MAGKGAAVAAGAVTGTGGVRSPTPGSGVRPGKGAAVAAGGVTETGGVRSLTPGTDGNISPGGWLSRTPAKLRERLGGRWLTTPEYRAGDLLLFTMFTVHASLDNHSRHIRLSSDTRYQLASDPVDERWIGPNPIGHGPAGKRGMIC